MTGWIILFSVLGVLALLMLLPIRFCFSFEEELKLTVWIAFVPLKIFPQLPGEPEQETQSKPQEQKENAKKSKKPNIFAEIEEKGLKRFLKFIKKLAAVLLRVVRRIGRHCIAQRCEAVISVGGDDAAAAAQQYGVVCAAAFPAWSELLSLTRCRKHQLQIRPDFLSPDCRVHCRVRIRIRTFWIVRAGVAELVLALRMILREKMHLSGAKTEKTGSQKA